MAVMERGKRSSVLPASSFARLLAMVQEQAKRPAVRKKRVQRLMSTRSRNTASVKASKFLCPLDARNAEPLDDRPRRSLVILQRKPVLYPFPLPPTSHPSSATARITHSGKSCHSPESLFMASYPLLRSLAPPLSLNGFPFAAVPTPNKLFASPTRSPPRTEPL